MISTSWKKFPNCARIEIDTYLHQNIPVFYVRCLELMFKIFSVFLKKDNCSKWFFGKISKLCRKTKLICIYFRDPWYSVLRFDTYPFIVFGIVTSFSLSGMLEMGKFSKPYSKDMDNLLKHLHILEVNPTGLLLKILNSIVRCNVSNIKNEYCLT